MNYTRQSEVSKRRENYFSKYYKLKWVNAKKHSYLYISVYKNVY